MMEFLLSLFINLSYIWGIRLRYAPFAGIIEPPIKKKLMTFYSCLLCVNQFVLTACFVLDGIRISTIQVNGFIVAALVVLTNRKLVKGRWKEHLFVFGMVESCTFLVLSIPILIVDLLGGFQSTGYYFFAAIIYGMLLLAIFRPVRRLLRNTVEPFLFLKTGNYWTSVWFIPFGIYFGMVFNSLGNVTAMSLPRVISRIFLSVTMVMLCLSTANDHRRMKAQQETNELLTDQKVHYAQLQARVESARKNAHNYMHHISAIRNLTEQGDLDGLRRYCDELTEEYGFRDQIPYSGNAAADGVIYRYIKLAREHGITFTCQGTIRSEGISDLDLCVLLGNALENAYAGCLTLAEGRQIQLVAEHDGSLLSILVINSFDGRVEQSGDQLLSRKRDSEPGLGVESMQQICERCGGTMQVHWDQSLFSVLFLLPIKS